MKKMRTWFVTFTALLFAVTALAEDGDASAQANNPLANMKAFNLHN